MALDKASIDRVFRFLPNTREQDEDIAAVYDSAHKLAEEIRLRVDEQYASQAIQQLVAVMTLCKTAIESKPRQAKPLVLV
jgi:hypothetical protein